MACACSTCYSLYQTAKDAQSDILPILNSVDRLKVFLSICKTLPKRILPLQTTSIRSLSPFKHDKWLLKRKLNTGNFKSDPSRNQRSVCPKKCHGGGKINEIERILATIAMLKTTFLLGLEKGTVHTMLKADESVGGLITSLPSINRTQPCR